MIITVVGGGGKTTVCTMLGGELSSRGCRALFTTTTHIRRPGGLPVFIGSPDELFPMADFMAAARQEVVNGDKLKGFTGPEIDAIEQKGIFDFIIVEGDGSNGRPVKAPAEWEPVYPAATKITIGVIGLDCLKNIATETFVHRCGLFCQLTGAAAGKAVTWEHLLRLIQSPRGLFRHAPEQARKIVFLNKADLMGNNDQVLNLMQNSDYPVILTSRDNGWPDGFIKKYLITRKG